MALAEFREKFSGVTLRLTVTGSEDIMRAVRSFDPCLPCGVHMYVGGGKVLTGMVKKVVGTDGSLAVSMFQDWGAGTSFCEALWDAAAAGDAVTFTFNADGSTFTGSVIPQFPNVGGAADAAAPRER